MSGVPGSAASVDPAVAAQSGDVHYVGLATRALSFVLDAVVINLVSTVVGLAAALILSLFHLPHDVRTVLAVIGGVAYVVWLVGYFVVFWSTTGQTPGARVMQIRVLAAGGSAVKPRRALLRFAGLLLAVLPLCLGFVPILFDDRRRAFQDWLAGTVVVEAPQLSIAQVRLTRARTQSGRQSKAALERPVGTPVPSEAQETLEHQGGTDHAARDQGGAPAASR